MLTTTQVAERYHIGDDKVRLWISNGELVAVNLAAKRSGRPRWGVTSEALAEFERRRAGGGIVSHPAPRRPRPPKDESVIEFYSPQSPRRPKNREALLKRAYGQRASSERGRSPV